MLIVWL